MLKEQFQRFLLWLMLVVGLVLYLSFGFQLPAMGVVMQEELAPGQMLYKAIASLRDRTGYSWQVVAFKEIQKGEESPLNLRLVGFPGAAEFIHPQPLQISADGGEVLTAADMFAVTSPASNVGQYDLNGIVKQLPESGLMLLFFPRLIIMVLWLVL